MTYSRALALLTALAMAGCSGPADPEDAGIDADVDASSPADAGFDASVECLTDEECDDGVWCNGDETCTDGMCTSGARDCDDEIDCTTDRCDETRRECLYEAPDADGDGVTDAACIGLDGLPIGRDCDDADAGRFPGNPEVCDMAGHDEDCDLTTYGSIDMDMDGHDEASCCNLDPMGGEPICGDDCDDANPNRSPSDTETCNGIDDDCDVLVDDIINGTVICENGETRPCTTTCGLMGTQACNDSCLGWDTCIAPEVCNGCDDDNNGADDDTFECIQGASGVCTVPVCGTTGVRLCSDSCSWSQCTATEICNYCDDDGDGDYFSERPLASVTENTVFEDCGGTDYQLFGTGTTPACSFVGGSLTATVLDGSTIDQAGALWFTPANFNQGWGTTTLSIEVEAEVLPGATTDNRTPVGGWMMFIASGATPSVGTGVNLGAPTGLSGVGAKLRWANDDFCGPNFPPGAADGSRAVRGSAGPPRGADVYPMLPTCSDVDGLIASGTNLDDPSDGVVTQRLELQYTPDDPTTRLVDEERLDLITRTPGSTVTRRYDTGSLLPLGSGPLSVAIFAGNYIGTGYTGPPPGWTMGAPVRLRARIWDMSFPGGPGSPPSFRYYQSLSRENVCP